MKTKEIIENLKEVEGELDCKVTMQEPILSEDYEYMRRAFKAARKALKRLQKENKKLRKENESLQEKIAELESENKLLKHREEHEYEEEFAGPAMG